MILMTSVYPNIYKISRLLPLCKPMTNPLLVNSYRPINNLPVIDKIIEEYMIEHYLSHFLNNRIIPPNHHGSRKNHIPQTALS